MAFRLPATRLNRVDFPTLGRPTNTTRPTRRSFLALMTVDSPYVKLAQVLTPVNYSTYDIYDPSHAHKS